MLTTLEIGYFKPGTPDSTTVPIDGPGPVPIDCPTDLNGDGQVNVLDLVSLLLCFGGPADPPCDSADTNGDGFVNVLDLIDLLLDFGSTCP